MYYIATVLLRMTEREFWKCTPRKLFALIRVHSGEEKEKPQEKLSVKELMSWKQ